MWQGASVPYGSDRARPTVPPLAPRHPPAILPPMPFLRCLTLLLAGATIGAAATGPAWPQFRGPDGNGLSTARDVPTEWSTNHNVRWRTVIPGSGWSSPVVSADRLYLTTAVEGAEGGGRSLRALAVDPETGAVRWDVEVFRQAPDAPSIHSKNGHASPTPVIDGDRVYVHFGHAGTACLDASGRVLWRQSGLAYVPVHGNGGSPILVGDRLVFSADGDRDPFVVALDRDTGRVVWRTPRETSARKKFSFSTAQAITVDGRLQVISPGSGAVCAYDPADGREIWRVRYGEGYSVITRPVFAHGLLYLSSGYDRPVVHAVRPAGASGDATASAIAWTLAKGAPNTPSLLVLGDEVYFVSDGGIATCADARTGAVHWNERLGGDHSASPVAAGGRLYFLNEAGVTTVVRAGREFEVLVRNDLAERALASPAPVDGGLFLRTAGHLWRIGVD